MPSDNEMLSTTTSPPTSHTLMAAEENRNPNKQNKDVHTGEDKEDSDSELSSKPIKIMKLENNQSENCCERLPFNKELQLPDQETRLELFKLLRKFFKCAFTIIIKMRRLCPTDAFEITRVLGVNVPRFLHPSSLEYVEEVSKKLILFLHRNSSEGCAIHIMIEKNKTLHVVQRFVFRTMGSLDVPCKNDTDENGLDLEEVKARCRASLLQILNSDNIKPMSAPQYSRWSISIGLQSELVEKEQIEQLWANDPSGNYFPWKKRLRSLAKVHKKENENFSINSSSDKNCDNSLRPYTCSTKETEDSANSEYSIQNARKDKSNVDKKSSTSTTQSNHIFDNDVIKTPKSQSDDAGKIICFPLSSFPITSNFMISIYGLEYPAPANSGSQHHVFSPRITRSPHASLRLSQVRSRLLRQSSNKM